VLLLLSLKAEDTENKNDGKTGAQDHQQGEGTRRVSAVGQKRRREKDLDR